MEKSLFTCPICAAPLERGVRAYACPNGHAYDRAREGYVHLLPANKKHSKAPGDDKGMAEARRRFLSGGYYGHLLAALCACTLSAAHVRVALRCLLLIDLAGQIGELLRQALGCSLDHIGIGALERFLNLFDLSLNACLLICGQLVAQIGQCLLGLEYQLLHQSYLPNLPSTMLLAFPEKHACHSAMQSAPAVRDKHPDCIK